MGSSRTMIVRKEKKANAPISTFVDPGSNQRNSFKAFFTAFKPKGWRGAEQSNDTEYYLHV